MKRLVDILFAALVLLAAPVVAQTGLAGRWTGELPVPGQVELESFTLELEVEGDAVSGSVRTPQGPVALTGTWDAAAMRASLTGQVGDQTAKLELALDGETLLTTVELWGGRNTVAATRPTGDPVIEEPLVVDLTVERPVTVSLDGLPTAIGLAVHDALESSIQAQRVVGLSLAVVLDGKVVDIRSFGWEDFGERVPATDQTMYRWASISKPLTAIAAHQLADAGDLDLDRDVRKYVPEFPDLGQTITTRHLLCHQSGVVHYRDMRVRTLREYDVEHPWADPIYALDLFKESPLLFEPGARYSYTTPGYVLLGAVVSRAGDAHHAEQIRERILRPLGMTTMQPDYGWIEIPHRTRGYQRTGDGRVIDSGDDDISWKLAAGGWISTVGDLARFGVGLIGDDLLEPETKEAMFTRQKTAAGEETSYGLGIGVGEFRGRKVVSHSGGQLKTSTFLFVVPEEKLAVALMCNTQGTNLSAMARVIAGFLIRR